MLPSARANVADACRCQHQARPLPHFHGVARRVAYLDPVSRGGLARTHVQRLVRPRSVVMRHAHARRGRESFKRQGPMSSVQACCLGLKRRSAVYGFACHLKIGYLRRLMEHLLCLGCSVPSVYINFKRKHKKTDQRPSQISTREGGSSGGAQAGGSGGAGCCWGDEAPRGRGSRQERWTHRVDRPSCSRGGRRTPQGGEGALRGGTPSCDRTRQLAKPFYRLPVVCFDGYVH